MSINRRELLRNGSRLAGAVAASAFCPQFARAASGQKENVRLSGAFPKYETFNPLVPVHCVTPELNGCIHRFFNTSPISPSGRYLALTRLLREDRLSAPGDDAEIVLVDLLAGASRVLAKTKGFDTQTGAHLQWGATDRELFFNDLDVREWRAFGVRMDPFSNDRRNLDGPVFEVSRDGKYAAGICLLRSAITQRGYGVVVPTETLPWNEGAANDDGVYLTETATGACRMLVSYKDVLDACGKSLLPTETDRRGGYHGHQISWNPQGTRLMLCLAFNYAQPFARNKRKVELSLITLKPDGSDIRVALPSRVWRHHGGHHPCWCPDGEHISMNLAVDGKTLRFVRMRYDGRDLLPLTEAVVGSGHPTLHPDARHLVADAYLHEPPSFGDGTVPIRWIDVVKGTERTLVRIRTQPPYMGPFKAMRVDPHPAWDRTFQRVAFNACPNGSRRVFLADLSQMPPPQA
jgi:hypothetical protein